MEELKCPKCGKKIENEWKFCNYCGESLNRKEEKKQHVNTANKVKVDIGEVINTEEVTSSTNKVAYIAKGWSLQVKNRGVTFAVLAFVIYFIMGIVMQSNSSYRDSTAYWLIYMFYGVIAYIIIRAIFNTTAFIIRMGAEVIQLLEDIKREV